MGGRKEREARGAESEAMQKELGRVRGAVVAPPPSFARSHPISHDSRPPRTRLFSTKRSTPLVGMLHTIKARHTHTHTQNTNTHTHTQVNLRVCVFF